MTKSKDLNRNVFISVFSTACALEDALLNKVQQLVDGEIADMAKASVVVDAVKEANLTATKSADEIIKLDKVWRATQGVDD